MADNCEDCDYMSDVIDDLHDEIERLRAELQQSRLNHLTTLSELQDAAEQSRRLRAALRLVTEHPSHTGGYANSAQHCESCAEIMETINDLRG